GAPVIGVAPPSALLIDTLFSYTQAQGMSEAMAESTRTPCLAIITASATIIPLTLTMLSFIHEVDRDFDVAFYAQIQTIVFLSSSALILSVLILLMLSIPLVESDAFQGWFKVMYYVLIFGVSAISGL